MWITGGHFGGVERLALGVRMICVFFMGDFLCSLAMFLVVDTTVL